MNTPSTPLPTSSPSSIAHLTPEEISRRFAVAISWVQNKSIEFPIKPSASQSLFFYGRYKQATCGDNTLSKPGIFSPIRRYMWSAWEKQQGKSQSQAKQEYVAEIESLCASYNLATLPPHLIEPADKFFTQYFETGNHPYVEALGLKRGADASSSSSSISPPPAANSTSPPSHNHPRSRFTSPERTTSSQPSSNFTSPIGLHALNGSVSGLSSPAVASSIRNEAVGLSSPATIASAIASPPRPTTNGRNSAVTSPQTFSTSSVTATPSSSSSIPSAATPPSSTNTSIALDMNSPARLASAAAEKELLARKLSELQAQNQAKMRQLEQQMAGLTVSRQQQQQQAQAMNGHNQPATPMQHTPYFATPLTTRTRQMTESTPMAQNGTNNGVQLNSLDPSSPFSAEWSHSGLTPRGNRLNGETQHPNTPLTPHPSAPHHHRQATPMPVSNAHTNHIARTTTRAAPNSVRRELKMNGVSHGTPQRSTNVRNSIEREPPPLDQTVAASAANSISPSTFASSSSSSITSSNAPISSADLDALLSTLDSKHQAQVESFQLAEASWSAQLAAAEQRAAELAQRIQDAEADRPSEERKQDNVWQFTLALQKDSLLHQVISSAKVAVPLTLAAYGGFKLWKEYQRRLRK